MLTYFIDSNQTSIVFDDGVLTVLKTTPEVVKLCKDGNEDKLKVLINLANAVLNGKVKVLDNATIINGITLDKDNKVHEFLQNIKKNGSIDTSIESIRPFLENCFDNPYIDPHEIYDYCMAQDFEITEDGCLLAYKNVDSNLGSIWDGGKTKHKVGEYTEVDVIDTNRNNLCSNGLHFCNRSYLTCYPGEVTIVVKVNPKDIVSIPTDYNFAKGRCKKYFTVGILNETLEKTATDNNEKVVRSNKPHGSVTMERMKEVYDTYISIRDTWENTHSLADMTQKDVDKMLNHIYREVALIYDITSKTVRKYVSKVRKANKESK